MINAKRSVSPLIATILLVALTVSIGAMIIGWGRQYVQQQAECLGYALEIKGAIDGNLSDGIISLVVENSGTKAISRGLIGPSLRFVAILSGGAWQTVEWQGVTNEANYTFNFTYMNYEEVGDPIRPGDIFLANIKVPNSTIRGYFDLKGCGRISNEWYIQ